MVKPGEQGANSSNETRSAAARRSCLWSSDGSTDGITLRVKFLNDIPSKWRYSGGGLNHESVLNLAKEWEKCGTVRFAEVKGDATADIRVKFIGKQVKGYHIIIYIDSVDSISRDGPDATYTYKKENISRTVASITLAIVVAVSPYSKMLDEQLGFHSS